MSYKILEEFMWKFQYFCTYYGFENEINTGLWIEMDSFIWEAVNSIEI